MGSLSLGTNIQALQVGRRLSDADRAISSTFERLSSGQRINRAADDAAGLAVSSTLRADSRIFSQGVRNISDGVSALNIADGALAELSQIVIRQRELAEQAANGVYSSTQRRALHNEADALRQEYNRIGGSVSFNGLKVLDGSVLNLQIQFGTGSQNLLDTSVIGEIQHAQGTGSFTPTVSWAGTYTDADFVDVNGDGKADLISTNNGNYFNVALSNGNGTFGAAASYVAGLPGGAKYFAMGDVNGDGISDFVGTSGDYLGISFGVGDGSFRTTVSYAVAGEGSGSQFVALADFTGDGALDVLTSSSKSSGDFSIVYNSGSGTFSSSHQTTSGNEIGSGIIADFNNDGKSDFINDSDELWLTRGVGQDPTSSVINALTGINMATVLATDYNGDGNQDLLCAVTGGAGSIRVLLGNGNGTFAGAATILGSTGTFKPVRYTDLNGDGVSDLVMQNTGAGLTYQISVALGNANGTFAAQQAVSLYGFADSNTVIVADVTGDGVYDIAAWNATSHTNSVLTAQTTQVTTEQDFSLTTAAGARSALTYLTSLTDSLSRQRGVIGAELSRLESAQRDVSAKQLQSTAAAARITDVDVAQASATLVRQQILQQTGASLLSHVNQDSQLTLTLLRG